MSFGESTREPGGGPEVALGRPDPERKPELRGPLPGDGARALQPAGLSFGERGPRLDQEVPPGGYAWWYLDALSDDRQVGLTIIAFVGCVFSPFYFRARQEGAADPNRHLALNVCVYGAGPGNWALTERDASAASRSPAEFVLGDSRMAWEGDALVVDLDEPRAPWPGRLQGQVRLLPRALHAAPVALDPNARHGWWAVAPLARVEVELRQPALRFQGSAYHDANWGVEPIEAGFQRWCWSRAELQRDAAVLFDVCPRATVAERPLGWRFRGDGVVEPLDAPLVQRLRPTPIFRLPRTTRSDAGGAARLLRTVEDTPFYARSWLETTLAGERVAAVHESLDLDRFQSPITQFMLPYRIRRLAGPA